jgi:class 3 adenylate cyclase
MNFVRRIKSNVYTKFWKRKSERLSIDMLYDHWSGMSHKYMLRHGIVCMIDLANFTTWCDKYSSQIIFQTMTQYNRDVNNILGKYDQLEKIEMVGDCIMVIGWVDNNKDVYTQMIGFIKDILSNISFMKQLFISESISLRVGIHEGMLCSGFLSNPRKYQVFGNAINIASRLQSLAHIGTCLGSTSTLGNIDLKETTLLITPKGDYTLKGVSKRIHCSQINI